VLCLVSDWSFEKKKSWTLIAGKPPQHFERIYNCTPFFQLHTLAHNFEKNTAMDGLYPLVVLL